MTNSCLLLSEGGIERVDIGNKAPNNFSLWLNDLTRDWQPCFVSRTLYWEKVVSYPTHNLLEVKNIVEAERHNISPISGKTSAYLVSVEKNITFVLYCCMPATVISLAHEHKLKRILPISLPYYRQLAKNHGDFQIFISSNELPDSKVGDLATSEPSSLLMSNNSAFMRSLPISGELTEGVLSYPLKEAKKIDRQASRKMLLKWHYLSTTDWLEPVKEHIDTHRSSLVNIGKYTSIVFASFFLAYIAFESAFLTIENKYLKSEVANNRLAAGESITASGKIKKIDEAIVQINTVRQNNVPKSILLQLFSDITKQSENLVFNLIEVYREDIRLRGTSDNATEVLSLLIKQQGFTNVEFSSPPINQKSGVEIFDIKMKYSASHFIGIKENDKK